MKHSTIICILVIQAILIACGPSNSNASDTFSIALLSGPWEKYLSSQPEILILQKTTKGIQDLLTEEQKLIQSVLDADASPGETSELSGLQDRLAELKAAIPSAETSSGYVEYEERYRRSYIYGRTSYINSRPYYTYSVFRKKSKSSSPQLVQSVAGIATNATLEDIDQRINALQHLISQWNHRTSKMSANGVSGIMREANEEYLDGLRDYVKDFIKIRSELRKIEETQMQRSQNKATILQEWKIFEETCLSILEDYFNKSDPKIIKANENGIYVLNEKQLASKLIMKCNVGPRTLYFELGEHNHPNHPFSMADVTVSND